MSFASITAFNVGEIDMSSSLGGEDDISNDDNQDEFFNKAMLVLFDFPDFSIISAYMLMAVVWAEAFMQSRRHWMSAVKFRRVWLLGYLIFNTMLYSVQVALYSLLFLPAVDKTIMTDLIYLTLTAINLVLPLMWLAMYFYLCIQFAGFPYSSPAATNRLSTLTRLAVLWTLARVGWGFIALTTVLNQWLVSYDDSTTLYSVEMIVIFTVTEIIPIVLSLQSDSLQALAAKPGGTVETTSYNQTSGSLQYRDVNSRSYSFSASEDLSNTVWVEDTKNLEADRRSPSFPYRSARQGSFDRSSVTSPRSSTTTEHAPGQRYAGGWLW
eukprot:CAMPEP_0185018308 /NCGR_PEP_ID=MMETSP1103-20130426/1072_1 /TAXON_ID=36769 /ORGANISM="Paraphysomonas bandaiensis, Strain Caron Lab Isolate" /LENGTH=324 /DNA_ID=CAMNT_0027548073 /DNA_START=252 /DNA_END=1223 /DNA_ORIENTATION=+